MNKPARSFAYSNAAFFIGAAIYVFTQGFIPYVEHPGTAATIVLIGFMLVYGNIGFVLSRRFTKKMIGLEYIPFVMAGILVMPAIFLSSVTEVFYGVSSRFFYYLCISASAILGAHLGKKAGIKKRAPELANAQN